MQSDSQSSPPSLSLSQDNTTDNKNSDNITSDDAIKYAEFMDEWRNARRNMVSINPHLPPVRPGWIRLTDAKGTVIREYCFDDKQSSSNKTTQQQGESQTNFKKDE